MSALGDKIRAGGDSRIGTRQGNLNLLAAEVEALEIDRDILIKKLEVLTQIDDMPYAVGGLRAEGWNAAVKMVRDVINDKILKRSN